MLKLGQPQVQPMMQSSVDTLRIELKNLQEENAKLKDVLMIRREVSCTLIRNHFKKFLDKLGQVGDIYSFYKPLSLRHNEIYNILVKEKNTVKEDEDI